MSDKIEMFLHPIPGLDPAGEHLRYTSFYDRLQEARRQEDESLPQGVWQQPLKKADWPLIEALCREGLQEKSKDLQLLSWLVHAQLMQKGIPALVEGFDLLHRFSSTFWENAYPRIDPNDPSLRLKPYEWLDQSLTDGLLSATITQTAARELANYTYGDWTAVLRLQVIAKSQSSPQAFLEKECAKLKLSPEAVIQSIRTTPPAFYQGLGQDLEKICAQTEALEDFLKEKLVVHGSIFSALKGRLKKVRHVCGQMATASEKAQVSREAAFSAAKSTTPEGEEDIDWINAAAVKEGNSEEVESPDSIDSRAQAYARLAEIEVYLREKEGLSPSVYALRQIATWENKSFPEIFQKIADNPAGLQSVLYFLGMLP